MKITIELTDAQLSGIKAALKITYADFLVASDPFSTKPRTTQFDYAERILTVRYALELSNADVDCVSDVENIPKRQNVAVK